MSTFEVGASETCTEDYVVRRMAFLCFSTEFPHTFGKQKHFLQSQAYDFTSPFTKSLFVITTVGERTGRMGPFLKVIFTSEVFQILNVLVKGAEPFK